MAEQESRFPVWKIWLYRVLLILILAAAIYYQPKTLVVVLAALIMLTVGVVWYIKRKLRKFVEPFKNFEIMPTDVQYEKVQDVKWFKSDEIDSGTTKLKSLGYLHAGDYTSPKTAGVHIRGFAHPDLNLYAALCDTEFFACYCDVVACFEDGTYLTHSSTPMPEILERPPGKPISRTPEVSIESLHEGLLANCSNKPRRPVALDAFASTIAQYVNEENTWRFENASQQHELDEKVRELFLEKIGWSGIEWSRRADRVLFIHERIPKHEVVSDFMEAISVDDDDYEEIQIKVNQLIENRGNREAFKLFVPLAPVDQPFELLFTYSVDSNLQVDAWLCPETDDDDDDDDY